MNDPQPIPSYVSNDKLIANPDEYGGAKTYRVHMHHLDPHGIIAFADSEDEAIDIVADYGYQQGYHGWFVSNDELKDYDLTEGGQVYDGVSFVGHNGDLPIDTSEIAVSELPTHLGRNARALASLRSLAAVGPTAEVTAAIHALEASIWGEESPLDVSAAAKASIDTLTKANIDLLKQLETEQLRNGELELEMAQLKNVDVKLKRNAELEEAQKRLGAGVVNQQFEIIDLREKLDAAVKRANHFDKTLLFLQEKTEDRRAQKKGFSGDEVLGFWRVVLTSRCEAPPFKK